MAGEIQLKSLTLPMADGSNQKYVIPQAPDVSRDIAEIQSAINDIEDDIAYCFSSLATYSVGDYVLYNGDLYKFTSNHSISSWNETHVTKVKITDELDKIKVVVLKATYNTLTTGVTTYMLPVTPSIITKYITDGNIVAIYSKVPNTNENYIFVVANSYGNELTTYNIKTNSIVIWNFNSAADRYEFQCTGDQGNALVKYPSVLRLAPSYNTNNKRVLNYKQSTLYSSFNYALIFFIKSNGTGYDTSFYVASSCTGTSITFKNLFGTDTLVFQAQDQNSYAVEQ